MGGYFIFNHESDESCLGCIGLKILPIQNTALWNVLPGLAFFDDGRSDIHHDGGLGANRSLWHASRPLHDHGYANSTFKEALLGVMGNGQRKIDKEGFGLSSSEQSMW
jgi:hypothetical protein